MSIPYQIYHIKAHLENPNIKYIFLRGAGGTGKTYAIAKFLEHYGYKHHQYLFLGPTGKSISVAEDKGLYGQTIHRWFKLLTSSTANEIDAHIKATCFSEENYLMQLKLKLVDVELVFIDEISMVNNEVLAHMMAVLTIKPSIKVIFAGDYDQLPSVITDDVKNANVETSLRLISKYITNREMAVVDFITRYRSEDEIFNSFLHNLRQGRKKYINPMFIAKFLRTHCNVYSGNLDEKLQHTLTFLAHETKDVDFINKLLLDDLPGNLYTYNMSIKKDIFPQNSQNERDKIIDSFQMDAIVNFKIGSKILFRVNDSDNLYKNGDEGIVENVIGDKIYVKKLSHWGDSIIEITPHTYKTSASDLADGFDIEITQLPFSLGTARTYHKSQGDGFLNLHLDFKFFKLNSLYNETKWQLFYVGLSRIIDPSKVWISEASIRILESQREVFAKINYDALGLVFDGPDMVQQNYIPRIK